MRQATDYHIIDEEEDSSFALPNHRNLGYGLYPMSTPYRKPKILYIDPGAEALYYEVIGLDRKLKSGCIKWERLPRDFPRDLQNLPSLQRFLPALLKHTSQVEHTPNLYYQDFIENLQKFVYYSRKLFACFVPIWNTLKNIPASFVKIKGFNTCSPLRFNLAELVILTLIGTLRVSLMSSQTTYERMNEEIETIKLSTHETKDLNRVKKILSQFKYGYSLNKWPEGDLKPNKLYVRKSHLGLEYQVLKGTEVRKGIILWKDLPWNFPKKFQTIEEIHNFLPKILKITSKRNHTLKDPKQDPHRYAFIKKNYSLLQWLFVNDDYQLKNISDEFHQFDIQKEALRNETIRLIIDEYHDIVKRFKKKTLTTDYRFQFISTHAKLLQWFFLNDPVQLKIISDELHKFDVNKPTTQKNTGTKNRHTEIQQKYFWSVNHHALLRLRNKKINDENLAAIIESTLRYKHTVKAKENDYLNSLTFYESQRIDMYRKICLKEMRGKYEVALEKLSIFISYVNAIVYSAFAGYTTWVFMLAFSMPFGWVVLGTLLAIITTFYVSKHFGGAGIKETCSKLGKYLDGPIHFKAKYAFNGLVAACAISTAPLFYASLLPVFVSLLVKIGIVAAVANPIGACIVGGLVLISVIASIGLLCSQMDKIGKGFSELFGKDSKLYKEYKEKGLVGFYMLAIVIGLLFSAAAIAISVAGDCFGFQKAFPTGVLATSGMRIGIFVMSLIYNVCFTVADTTVGIVKCVLSSSTLFKKKPKPQPQQNLSSVSFSALRAMSP